MGARTRGPHLNERTNVSHDSTALDPTDEQWYTNGSTLCRHYGTASTGDDTTDKIWKQLMFEWYGLRPCQGEKWITWSYCPHRIGLRERRPRNCHGNCKPHTDLWDHARAWRTDTDDCVITLEPYSDPFSSTNEYIKLAEPLKSMDIKVLFKGRSPYGASYMLMLVSAHCCNYKSA